MISQPTSNQRELSPALMQSCVQKTLTLEKVIINISATKVDGIIFYLFNLSRLLKISLELETYQVKLD